MISPDMVAYNTGADTFDIYGRTASNPLKYALADAIQTYGQGVSYYVGGTLDGSDHASFEWEGIPACLLIEDWGNPYYHTPQDNINKANYLDYAYATKATRSVVGFLVDNAGVIVEEPTGDFDGNGEVDLYDYGEFDLCFTGPDGGPIGRDCFEADFDLDYDVDCGDYGAFVQAWTDPYEDPPLRIDCLCPPTAGPVAEPEPVGKNRYLSFTGANEGVLTGARVTLVSLQKPDPPNSPEYAPLDYSAYEGAERWLGAPVAWEEFGGNGNQICDPGPLNPDEECFTAAPLVCLEGAEWRDWSPAGLEADGLPGGVIHVFGEEILPSSSYRIQFVHEACGGSLQYEEIFSEELMISTDRWGDVAEPYQLPAPEVLYQPDFFDVSAVIDRWQNLDPAAPLTVRADLDPAGANQLVNFFDTSAVLDAWNGLAYPYPITTSCP
jgi:hypothetical protein